MQNKPKAAGEDLRFAPRRKRRIPALVMFDGVVSTLSCHIVDISTTGARLEMPSGWENAMSYVLDRQNARVRLFERIEKVSYDCKIIRYQANELALKFMAPPVLPDPARRK